MKLELISTKRCPFVQRSVIMLNYKGIDYEMTFVDIENPPDWFRQISPFGKVPVLRVDDETVIFESAVINEFLDDVTPGQLHPEDPLQRALNKSWIEFGGACCSLTFQIMTAPDRQEFDACVAELGENLARVDVALGKGPYFNGESFALIDAAYAPVFIRLDEFEALLDLHILDDLPKMKAWAATLLAMPAVQSARVPELRDLFRQLIESRNAYARNLLRG
ncbi:MAG: glutathione S-transferase family protein [Gammaproteobacteria bacterium]|nr:glutathione S-transferase family protein [Gammaproteobacteria bacterium]